MARGCTSFYYYPGKKNIMLSAYCRRPRSVCFHFDFRWGGNEGATVADRLLDADTKSGRLLSFGQRPENKQRPSVTGDTITFHLDFFYFFFNNQRPPFWVAEQNFLLIFLFAFYSILSTTRVVFSQLIAKWTRYVPEIGSQLKSFPLKKKKICKLAGAV